MRTQLKASAHDLTSTNPHTAFKQLQLACTHLHSYYATPLPIPSAIYIYIYLLTYIYIYIYIYICTLAA